MSCQIRMAKPATYYDVLEIPQTASQEEARSAYLKLVKEYHPDRLVGVPDHLSKIREDAKQKWLEIQDAWAVIGNPQERRRYDETLGNGRGSTSPQGTSSQASAAWAAATSRRNAPPRPPPEQPPPQDDPAPQSFSGTWAAVSNTDILIVGVILLAVSLWWFQTQMPDGSRMVSASIENIFVSEEQLNNNLAQRISDDQVATAEKLAQIDALLKRGAKLNGDGGKHGAVPLRAAIETNNVELLKALMARGLNIQQPKTCSAHYATGGSTLRPGGDVMLAFLLDNGMQLGCLGDPPLHSFLRFGITTPNYPVDGAIRVADVLLRHGASVSQRDSQGESIWEVLNRSAEPVRLTALKEWLTKNAAQPTIYLK